MEKRIKTNTVNSNNKNINKIIGVNNKMNNNNNNNRNNNNRNNNNRNNNNKGNNKGNNINTTIRNIKNKSFSNKVKDNKNVIFLLVVLLFIVIVCIVGYYIYKKYPEVLSFYDNNNNNNNNNEEKKLQNNINKMRQQNNLNKELQEQENGKERKRRTEDSNMVNLLNNVKNNTFKVNTNNKKQVFNIANNIFNYDDAEAVCKAHGADLASYEQVVDSYSKGAEWCNYGWSKNQMALYPTQKKTWQKLQGDPETANSCGDWGVNGGYFENKDTLFGVNCYGVKPEPKDRERTKTVPVSIRGRDILNKVKMYRENRNDITVNPFNNDLWSQ